MKQFNQPIFHHLLLFLILITQVIPFSDCCHDDERNALLTFKSFLIDPMNRLLSWQVGKKCCNWEGIHCSNDSLHVVSVDLRNLASYNLSGAISPSLFNLSHLRYLDLSYNNFNFPKTPYQFANPKHLTHLDLSYNNLSGAIPPSLFNLNHLRYLDLSHNNFHCSKIPYQFANLKHLTHLDLSYSQFSGSITTQFANLSWLRYLDVSCSDDNYVSRCSVSSIDTNWLRGLANLEELRLKGVYLNSPNPIQLANLTSLSILHLINCKLQAGSLPYLPPKLKEVYMRDNPDLSINLSLISNVSLLNHLGASNCSIQGSLSSITNLSQLQYLNLGDNNITGQIPSSMSNLKNLKELYLDNNNLQGKIPKSICEISSLQLLNLGTNNMTETIPSCILKLGNLTELDVSENSIEGTISLISLINTPKLIYVFLSSNRITVELNQQHPPLPSKLQQIGYLALDSCNIKGYIPGYFCNMTNLVWLRMNGNNITGTIPSCFSKLKNLNGLDLSSNNLQGTIPHSLLSSNMTSLVILDLSSNNLRGHLPLPHSGFAIFDLSKNKFTGGISTEVGEKLSKMGYVYLSHNKLSGSIPSSICSSDGLGFEHLDLSMNQLHGTIPSSIQYCRSLISLNLGYNNLSGSIPTSIGSLHNLKILYLRSNKFNGLIPKEITHLQKLQILDLSINNLSGSIPMEIGYLKMLRSIPKNRSLVHDEDFYGDRGGRLQLQMMIKGTMIHIERLYNYNAQIDLSCNNLDGKIPEEMCLLQGLPMLNLSHNSLSGRIPTRVGNMTGLESLDLSFNKLSGDIPESLASIDFLGYLNLSYNNLSGRIPKGHLETLGGDNGSTYFGNYWLCGFPTNSSCPVEPSLQEDEHGEDDDDEDASEKWLLCGIVFLGFGVGFWGLFLVLLLNKEKWWFGYWRAVDTVAERIAGCVR